MAQVDAEKITLEELQQKRLEKAKAMVSWKKEDLTQTFTIQVAEVLTEASDAAEDVLRGLAVVKFDDGDKATVEKMTGTLRKMHKSVKDQLLKVSVANKMGLQAVNKIFEPAGYEGMTAEQEKAMQAYIKEQQDGGGKWKKGGATNKAASASTQAAPSAPAMWTGQQTAGMAMGQPVWQGQFPYATQQPWGWQAAGLQQLYGLQAQPGGQSRNDRKARFPCDNCGQLGHWKYQPVCPNYHVHLESLHQAAEAYRGGAGAAAAAGDSAQAVTGAAVVPYTGRILWSDNCLRNIKGIRLRINSGKSKIKESIIIFLFQDQPAKGTGNKL
jgi:hypothetical protein